MGYVQVRFCCEFRRLYACTKWTQLPVSEDVNIEHLDPDHPSDKALIRLMGINGWRWGNCQETNAVAGCVRGGSFCRGHFICPVHYGEDYGSLADAIYEGGDDEEET